MGSSLRCIDSIGLSAVEEGLSRTEAFGRSRVAPLTCSREPYVAGLGLLAVGVWLKAVRLGFRGTEERFCPGR